MCRYSNSMVGGYCATTIHKHLPKGTTDRHQMIGGDAKMRKCQISEVKTTLSAGTACERSCTEDPGDEVTLLVV